MEPITSPEGPRCWGWNQSQSQSLISMHGHKNDATRSFQGNMRSVGMISNGCLCCFCCCVTRVSHKAFVTMLTAMGAMGYSREQMCLPRNEHSVMDGERRSEENQTINVFDPLCVRRLTSVKRRTTHGEWRVVSNVIEKETLHLPRISSLAASVTLSVINRAVKLSFFFFKSRLITESS